MNSCYPFVNTPLPYSYDALEPYIDEKTMHLHHDKHLQSYITNLNHILELHPTLQKKSLHQLITGAERLPESIKRSIRNQAGGVFNHRFYFDGMKHPSKAVPIGKLVATIDCTFGNFTVFREQFKKAALSLFGSGYAWLVLRKNRLCIITTCNQNTPLGNGIFPILNIDVWEHAYYLKDYNERSKYIDDWFSVVNWEKAEERYLAGKRCKK